MALSLLLQKLILLLRPNVSTPVIKDNLILEMRRAECYYPHKILNNLSSCRGDDPERANKLANQRFKGFSCLDHGLQVIIPKKLNKKEQTCHVLLSKFNQNVRPVKRGQRHYYVNYTELTQLKLTTVTQEVQH